MAWENLRFFSLDQAKARGFHQNGFGFPDVFPGEIPSKSTGFSTTFSPGEIRPSKKARLSPQGKQHPLDKTRLDFFSSPGHAEGRRQEAGAREAASMGSAFESRRVGEVHFLKRSWLPNLRPKFFKSISLRQPFSSGPFLFAVLPFLGLKKISFGAQGLISRRGTPSSNPCCGSMDQDLRSDSGWFKLFSHTRGLNRWFLEGPKVCTGGS